MDKGIIDVLQKQGMSYKEAVVYATVLELGSAPASSIARRAGINRSSIYVVLKKMIQEGYVHEIVRKEVSYFSAVSPELLLQSMENKIAGFKEIVPQLLSIFSGASQKPVIKYFEGDQGVKQMFELFATTETDMRAILGTPKYFNEKLMKHLGVYRRARKNKGLQSLRVVTHDMDDKQVLRAGDQEFNRQTRVISDLPFGISADINIFGPGIVTFLFFDSDELAHLLVIENNDVYESLYSLFEFIWKNCETI